MDVERFRDGAAGPRMGKPGQQGEGKASASRFRYGVKRRQQPRTQAIEQRGICAENEIEKMIVDEHRLRPRLLTGGSLDGG
jgi:hypothetical protein